MKHFIDWEAYKQGLSHLQEAEKVGQSAPEKEVETRTRDRPRQPVADPGAELLARQSAQAEQTARVLAAGNVGRQLGNLKGKGLAPVGADEEGTSAVLSAVGRHNALQQLLGDRLHHNYQQRLKLEADADRQEADQAARLQLQQLKGRQDMERQKQRLLFGAAVQTQDDEKKPTPTNRANPKAKAQAARRGSGGGGRTRAAERPYVIADTDGKQVFGHWNLTPDEAAQLLQTAIDLGNQAQLDYAARLAGAEPDADRKTTTARLMALQQKALMGNADARQRMVQLLSAIIPSLKGQNVIDGILRQKYQRSKVRR